MINEYENNCLHSDSILIKDDKCYCFKCRTMQEPQNCQSVINKKNPMNKEKITIIQRMYDNLTYENIPTNEIQRIIAENVKYRVKKRH